MTQIPYLAVALNDAVTEMYEAHEQHGSNSMFCAGPDRAMTILTEEVGEAATEINDAHIKQISPYHPDFYHELIQVAAMALTMAARTRQEMADVVA